ncbi:MAG TPA: nucleotidyltransferase family protein [Streptosporangiaceae bacterium]|nr:nucleotidyltransferase family protein [Streptosporangiaceae bacterium]
MGERAASHRTASDRTASDSAAGVLLAAGEGRRLGTPKALVEVGGVRLVDRGVRLLRDGGCDPVVVVTGAVVVAVPGALAVHNPDWRAGMSTSFAAGLGALPGTCPAAVVALVDQPLVGPEAVRRLVAAWRGGAGLAVATYGGRPRNPVLFERSHWASAVAAATGDAGARGYLRAQADQVSLVECADTGSPDDLDTPADLARISQLLARR